MHGLSRRFDPDAYEWGDRAWTGRPLAGGVVYELHIGTFTPEGTLDAAIGRLGHLVRLGVDFVELLPVNAFNGTHNWGYDGVLWYAVQEEYGGPAAYQRFVDACHQQGLGVIQDVVYNHLGPSGNYLPEFFPIFAEGGANTWGNSINLSGPDSDEVRRYIIDNALMWLRDMHVDGLRLDAVHALVDERATHVLEEMAQEVDRLSVAVGRPLTLIAESDLNDPRMVTPRVAGGLGLTAQWSDDFHHALHSTLTGEGQGYYADFAEAGLAGLAKVLTGAYFHDGMWSSFRRRHHGRPVDTATPARLEVPRVPAGPRPDRQPRRRRPDLGHPLPRDARRGRDHRADQPVHAHALHGRGVGASTPWQFFTSHPEPELGKATAEGRIGEFAEHGWDADVVPDPQDPETFVRSKLDWSELDKEPHDRLLAVHRALLSLRRAHPDLVDADLSGMAVTWDDADRWLVVHRGSLRVVVNLAEEPREIDLDVAAIDVLFATGELPTLDGETVTLPAESAAVLSTVCDAPAAPRSGTAGRRRPGGGLPAATGPVAAGQLRRLARRRRDRRRGQRGARVPGRPTDLHRPARSGRRRARGARPRRPRARADPAESAVGRLRISLGRPATAPIAVVSRRASLDPAGALATEGDSPTILVTCAAADPARRAALTDAGVTVLVRGRRRRPAHGARRWPARPRAGAVRGRAVPAARRAERRSGRTSSPCRSRRPRRRPGGLLDAALPEPAARPAPAARGGRHALRPVRGPPTPVAGRPATGPTPPGRERWSRRDGSSPPRRSRGRPRPQRSRCPARGRDAGTPGRSAPTTDRPARRRR